MNKYERPPNIAHYSTLQLPDNSHYPDSEELLSIGAPLGKMLEFAFVIEGNPDVWQDGILYRLNPGDAVNKIYYPLHTEQQKHRKDLWDDHPKCALGPHDGMPDKVRK